MLYITKIKTNSIMEYNDELNANCRMAQQVLCDDAGIGSKIEELEREIEVVNELLKK